MMWPSLETTLKTITVAGNFVFITLGMMNHPDLHLEGAGNGPVVITWIGIEHELYCGASPISLVEHYVSFRYDRRLLLLLGFVHNCLTSRWSATKKENWFSLNGNGIILSFLGGNFIVPPFIYIFCIRYIYIYIYIYLLYKIGIDRIKENSFKLKKERSRRYPTHTIMDVDYANDIAFLAKTPTQPKTLLHSLQGASAGIGLHVNSGKMEYVCFTQRGDISTLNWRFLQLVDKFTYFGRSISSTEKDINTQLATDKIKHCFFKAAVVSILLY